MIYLLSKENLDLAREEVLALTQPKHFETYGNILICEGEIDFTRLAFTNKIFENIFISDKIEDINWEKYYNGNFCVRSNITHKEKDLAKIIWDKLKNPCVKLKNSSSEFNFFFINGKIICGKKIFERTEKFHLRRPDIRPGFFPISLKPKLARALVNISGVKVGKIWDPFCGTGGILIEAALIGLDIHGTDIDPIMVQAARSNFEKYNLKPNLEIADARKVKISCTAIVTDPPYGRRASSKKVDIEDLYNDFLDHAYNFVDKIVIMMPNNLQIKTKYNIQFETEDYVHNTLTRKILVLNKCN